MNRIEPRTLKGFRDFLPEEVLKRQYVIDTLRSVFGSFGFEPLETPSLEYADILTGKYGDEGDKLMYKFKDNGDRDVALRYDQTVPLARVIAQYRDKLPLPFKRYQIQNVWRAENTQKGRFREFLQCDIDITGTDSTLSDAEIINVVYKSLEKLNITDFKILINDRQIFKDIPKEAITTIDKLKKIGEQAVAEELESKGLDSGILNDIKVKSPTERIDDLFGKLEQMGLVNSRYEFSPTLARGLDYYTGIIIEVEINEYSGGSVGGGGRYDELVGMFSNQNVPAVGFAFGFDRLIDAIDELELFPEELSKTRALMTIFSPELTDKSLEIAETIRAKGGNIELYLDPNAKMEKQLKYADMKKLPFALIIGPEEVNNQTISIKNLVTREQKTSKLDELLELLTK